MRTAIIIVGGLVLLGVLLLVGRRGGRAGTIKAISWFLPLWFAAAAFNMWVGVARAGYSMAEELPIFLVIFGLPAAAAAFVWWKAKTA